MNNPPLLRVLWLPVCFLLLKTEPLGVSIGFFVPMPTIPVNRLPPNLPCFASQLANFYCACLKTMFLGDCFLFDLLDRSGYISFAFLGGDDFACLLSISYCWEIWLRREKALRLLLFNLKPLFSIWVWLWATPYYPTFWLSAIMGDSSGVFLTWPFTLNDLFWLIVLILFGALLFDSW